ncbi:MAG: MBL fold metallo-hydrolase [Candidatus Omnitrophica bacterium]|nr:MBL fold metallo-hydrolase [Candidatus Omnitrophota bacterium]
MYLKTLIVGMMEANCYIVGEESTKEVFIVDPGGDYKKIKKIIDADGLRPQAVINTHGHGDHIGADGEFGLPVWIHRLDAEFLQDPSKNLSGAFGFLLKTKKATRLLEDGDILKIGQHSLEVIHTPGHTPGSICLKGEGVVFTGDTLFCEGVGRTDFVYGSEDDIMRSIKERLLRLDDDYVVYPGHGPTSTIGNEKTNNPFIT